MVNESSLIWSGGAKNGKGSEEREKKIAEKWGVNFFKY